MTLAQFKHIYWWEFIHRLLGRLIGVVFALPLAWFAWKRAIPFTATMGAMVKRILYQSLHAPCR